MRVSHLGHSRQSATRQGAQLTQAEADSYIQPPHADVAELADAQVSEACDGDIVEVQVLSSAP